MQSNLLLKVIAGVGAVVVVMVGARLLGGGDTTLQQADSGPPSGNGLGGLTSEQVKNLGVEGDTPEETMKTLVARVTEYEKQSRAADEKNQALANELEKTRRMGKIIEERVERKVLQEQRNALADQNSRPIPLLDQMTRRIDELENNYFVNGSNIAPGGDIPGGLGINGQVEPDIVWIDPLDAVKVEDNKSQDGFSLQFPDKLADQVEASSEALTPGSKRADQKKKDDLVPFFTVPANATMMGSVAMSAMLGRIPINGAVVDPYPVKLMVGPENLSSNGIYIPGDVTGIVMSGIAKGDWTLSCVSADITSMTFTFSDGTIRTIPEPGEDSGDPLGWISDKHGVPCVTGERITNAPQYLGARIGLGVIDAYAQALAAAETTTTVSDTGTAVTNLTGDPKVAAKNSAISGGTTEILDWIDQRMQQSFDAIYVEPGTDIVINVTKQLDIDYNKKGRKVNFYASQSRNQRNSRLD